MIRHAPLRVLFRMKGTGPVVDATFTRSDANATRFSRKGLVETVAANKLRSEWVDLDGDGRPDAVGYLIEGPQSPLFLKSRNFADGAVWVNGGGCTVTADALLALDGAISGDKLDFTTTTSTNFLRQRFTIADPENRTVVFTIWLHDGIGAGALTEAGDGFQIFIRRSDGTDATTFVVGNGTLKLDRRRADGWARWWARKTFSASAVGDDFEVLVRSNGAIGHFYAWQGQLVEATTPTSDLFTDTTIAGMNRVDEVFHRPLSFSVPNDITILARFARSAAMDPTPTIPHIGIYDFGDGGTNHIWAYADGTTKGVFFAQDSDATTIAPGGGQPQLPATREIVVCQQVKNLWTGPQTRGDVGAGFSAYGGVGKPLRLFSNARVRIGGITNSAGRLHGTMLELVAVEGLHDTARLLETFPVSS